LKIEYENLNKTFLENREKLEENISQIKKSENERINLTIEIK
jgi:hypothetical protein